jgi:hypothetical protein
VAHTVLLLFGRAGYRVNVDDGLAALSVAIESGVFDY